MKQKHRKKSKVQREIAQNSINELFSEADKIFQDEPGLANRYVEIARKISMKFKVKLSSVQTKKFCKTCHNFLVPGKNCRVRLTNQKLVYYCFSCKNHMRFPYSKKKNKPKKVIKFITF